MILAYNKIDPAIILFIDTIRDCQRIILVFFMYKSTFWPMQQKNCYQNFAYAYMLPKTILIFTTEVAILLINLIYHKLIEWYKKCI